MTRTSSAPLRNRLRALRAQRDLTQAELAEQVQVSRQTIVAIEKEEYNPSIILALRLAGVLGATVEEIFWLQEAAEERA